MSLIIKHLSKHYGDVPVFSHVNLRVAPGEFVAIIGESGVGKSTLLNCMAGLDTWNSGSVVLDGQDLSALSDEQLAHLRRAKTGFVFQAFHVLPTLTVAQNIAVPLLLTRVPVAEHSVRIETLLDRVGIKDFGQRWPASLSGGELQRVAIARALVHQPQLILADEPTGNLDPRTANEVLSLLLERCREQNTAALIVTHSAQVAARCDRVLTLTPDGLQGVSA